MNNQNIKEEDYTENEVKDIFLLACEKGRLDFVKFFMHNQELKYNVNLKNDGYSGLKTALHNKNGDIVKYLFSFPEVQVSPYFNLTDIFTGACTNNLSSTIEVLIQFAVNENLKLPYSKGFSLACLANSLDVLSLFTSHQYIQENIGMDFMLDQFDFALKHSNPEVIKFFLTNENLNFRINPKYYNSQFSGFSTKYKRFRVSDNCKPLIANYDQINELLLTLPVNSELEIKQPKKKLKI